MSAYLKIANNLQSKIQSLKKTASKGDKKKKKEVAEEIAKLEQELDEKHEKELAELSSRTSDKPIEATEVIAAFKLPF